MYILQQSFCKNQNKEKFSFSWHLKLSFFLEKHRQKITAIQKQVLTKQTSSVKLTSNTIDDPTMVTKSSAHACNTCINRGSIVFISSVLINLLFSQAQQPNVACSGIQGFLQPLSCPEDFTCFSNLVARVALMNMYSRPIQTFTSGKIRVCYRAL